MIEVMEGIIKLTQPRLYQAYLVRLWREEVAAPWGVIVIHVATGEQHHFASLEEGLMYLKERAEKSGVSLANTDLNPPRS